MKKKYIARAVYGKTNGIGIRFVFESESRANSYQNLCDATNTWIDYHHGSIDVIHTYLAKDCDLPVGMILS